MKRVSIIAIAVLFMAVYTPIDTLGAMFFPVPQPAPYHGARAMGMGGAVVACVDDFTSAYWNPAGLGLSSGGFGMTGLVQGHPSFVFEYLPYSVHHLYGIPSYSEYQELIDEIQSFHGAPQFETAFLIAAQMDWFGLSFMHHDSLVVQTADSDRILRTQGLHSNRVALAGAKKYDLEEDQWIALGASLNFDHQIKCTREVNFVGGSVGLERISGLTLSMDVGVIYQPSQQIRLGMTIHDAISFGRGVSDYTLIDVNTQQVLFQREDPVTLSGKPVIDLGFCYAPARLDGVLFSVDLHGIRAAITMEGFAATAESLHIGFEKRFGSLTIWLGNEWFINEWDYVRIKVSGGIGYDREPCLIGVAIYGGVDERWAAQGTFGYRW